MSSDDVPPGFTFRFPSRSGETLVTVLGSIVNVYPPSSWSRSYPWASVASRRRLWLLARSSPTLYLSVKRGRLWVSISEGGV